MGRLKMVGFNVESRELSLMQNTFIEASAGTGKTYAIITWILRLLIEKGLKIDQILVVTFTRLATLELKKRIRETIWSTYLLIEEDGALPDYLIPYVETEEGRISVQRILKAALAFMEDAKVMTIHSFAAYLINQYKNCDEHVAEASLASKEQLHTIM